MVTTREMIQEWWTRGKAQNATHMIIVCDTFDHEDYPVFVMPGEDVHQKVAEYNGPNMQRVMEVYNFAMKFEKQLAEYRAFNC